MTFAEWKRTIWPTLPEETKAAIRREVAELRNSGWELQDAWVQAACVY